MIAYTLKESPRAKQVRVQVSPTEGVIVVAPTGISRAYVETLLQQRQTWIEKHLHRFASQKQRTNPRHTDFPPASLNLRAIDQVWHFSYQAAARSRQRVIVPGELQIEGDMTPDALQRFFRHWLSQQAKQHLVPKLHELSQLSGLAYNKAAIKCQTSRWGSCSSLGNINLNLKLLFLPSPIARYVLIHELAHTRHLNHSATFWQLVERLEPDYRALDKALNAGWCYVPEWV